MRTRFFSLYILLLSFFNVFGQDANDKEAAYTRTITARAEKIVQALGITDSLKAKHITTVIAAQYRTLSTVYTERDDQVNLIKRKGLSKEAADSEIKQLQDLSDKKVQEVHNSFLVALESELTPEQVMKVKDGMTYNVVKVTYDAYVDMIPTLTKEQKGQIMVWLVEAREHAMDGESSEKKHWWFGKYKGRINNYLSAQGYDITRERKEWEARTKPAEQKKRDQIQ
jgi:hypothetical protein